MSLGWTRISRRSIVKAAGTAALGAAATAGRSQEPMRVNLICHGMMLFFYDNRNIQNLNSLFIRIPMPPQADDGHYQHEISLTTMVGAKTYSTGNLLRGPDEEYRLGAYELNLGPASRTAFTRANSRVGKAAAPDRSRELVFYDPDTQLVINRKYLWFQIHVSPRMRSPSGHRSFRLPRTLPIWDKPRATSRLRLLSSEAFSYLLTKAWRARFF